jgi:hypothetical protein
MGSFNWTIVPQQCPYTSCFFSCWCSTIETTIFMQALLHTSHWHMPFRGPQIQAHSSKFLSPTTTIQLENTRGRMPVLMTLPHLKNFGPFFPFFPLWYLLGNTLKQWKKEGRHFKKYHSCGCLVSWDAHLNHIMWILCYVSYPYIMKMAHYVMKSHTCNWPSGWKLKDNERQPKELILH